MINLIDSTSMRLNLEKRLRSNKKAKVMNFAGYSRMNFFKRLSLLVLSKKIR